MSTSTSRARLSRPKALLALLTSFLVVLSGLFVVPAASAAEVPSVSVTQAPRTGGEVTVTGTGFDGSEGAKGIYVGLGPAGLPGFYKGAASLIDTVFVGPGNSDGASNEGRTAPLHADGSFSTTFAVPAYVEGSTYAIYTSRAHGEGVKDPSQNSITPVPYAPAPAAATSVTLESSLVNATEGSPVTLTATVDPAEAVGSVTFVNGSEAIGDPQPVVGGAASVTTGALAAGSHSFMAQFVPADAAAFVGATSQAVNVVVTAEDVPAEENPTEENPAEEPPALEESSPITGTDGAAFTWAFKDSWNSYLNGTWTMGKTIVSEGATRGEDGVIGFAAATDEYDASTDSGVIKYEGAVRYVSALHGFDIAMADPWVEFGTDGARITAEVSNDDGAGTKSMTRITVAELDEATSSDAEGKRIWSDVTTTLATPLQPAGWARYAGQAGASASFSVELATEWVPAIEVFEADGVTKLDSSKPVYDGDEIVVRGTGFDPKANVGGRGVPIPNTLPQGSYVVFGNFAEQWQPSADVPSSARATGPQAWVLSADVLEQVPPNFQGMVRAQWAELSADGTFEATLELAPLQNRDRSPATLPDGGSYGVYTYGAGGVKNADQELSVQVNYQGERQPGEPGEPGEGEPGEPGDGDDDGVIHAKGLTWGFKSSWNFYLDFVASGKRAVSGGATLGDGGAVNFVPAPGSTYDPATGLGTVKYAGMVTYSSDFHGFEIAVSDPWVEFSRTGAVLTARVSTDDTAGASSMKRIPMVVLTDPSASKTGGTGSDSTVRWDAVEGTFHDGLQPESWTQYAGDASDPITFAFDPNATPEAPAPSEPAAPKPKPQPKPQAKPTPAAPVATSQEAGSLTWGVSTDFARYVTGNIAKGGIATNGVGGGPGGYVFPQATGGSWNAATQTGTVRYSGVVTFTGHHGQLNESASNPVITVTSASSATLSTGGRTFGLNLGAASKTVGANGEVTWSGVPVSGGFAFGSHHLAADGLTFTVGAPSQATHGASTQGTPQESRAVPDTPPAATGVTMITDAEKIRPGATIEIEAHGFQPDEWGIMTVLYSEPTVLDTEATADENGHVRWIGTLPTDLEPGTHTITLQGSIAVGTEIEVLPAEAEELMFEVTSAETLDESARSTAIGVAEDPEAGNSNTALWIGAAVLLLIAAGGVGLVLAQRRRAGTA